MSWDELQEIQPSTSTSTSVHLSASNEVLVAATREAAHLTDKERQIILAVLTKDEQLRRQQQMRVIQLKAELQSLRRKGAIKVPADWSAVDSDRSCGRCRVELGRVINRGAYCKGCRLKVCKGCREYNFRATDWICTVCHKRMEIQAASGEWMNEFVRKPSRRRDTKVYVPAADIIKRTIRRSWTISNPTPRWAALRGSQELRPYNSLPRAQDINNYPSLALYQTTFKNTISPNSNIGNLRTTDTTIESVKRSPTRRAKSEDVYAERNVDETNNAGKQEGKGNTENPSIDDLNVKRPIRVNPLMSISLREGKEDRQRRRSPRRKTEPVLEVCSEISEKRSDNIEKGNPPIEEQTVKRPIRINPLMSISLRESKEDRERRKSPRRKTEPVLEVDTEISEKTNENIEKAKEATSEWNKCSPTLQSDEEKYKQTERHVSFDSPNAKADLAYFRSRSLSQSKSSKDVKKMPFTTRSLPEDGCGKDETSETNNDGPTVELCDIEPISGTVFRKMTVRRRRQENMRKMPAVDAGWRKPPDPELIDIFLPDGEDYRLVFVNSDSSSKEEDVDDNDTNDSSSASSFPIDECDWDYFEPGANRAQHVLGLGSPFGSPREYRKRLLDSPLGSPLLHRRRPRIRESSDEDTNSSPCPSEPLFHPRATPGTANATHGSNAELTSTIEALQCVHQSITGQSTNQTYHPATCKSCGGSAIPTAQYIPIPVPVPIPFPVPWGTSLPPSTIGNFATINLIPLYKSLPNLNRGNAQASDFWQYLAQVPGFPWQLFEKPMIDKEKEGCKGEGDEMQGIEEDKSREAGAVDEVEEDNEPRGHLECENRGSSASESTSSDSSDEEPNQNQPRVRRTYNVSGPPSRDSDDALPSSNVSTDNEDELENKSSADEKEREEEETSSGSADTDSNDTGTVADQKPRKFSRVFVVNHQGSSSSSRASTSSCDTDSSDNDTDTELDCSIVLTNMKHLNEDKEAEKDESKAVIDGVEEQEAASNDGGASFISMRYIGEDDININCDKNKELPSAGSSGMTRRNSSDSLREFRSRRSKNRRGGGKKGRKHDKSEFKEVSIDNFGCDLVLEKSENSKSNLEKCKNYENENVVKNDSPMNHQDIMEISANLISAEIKHSLSVNFGSELTPRIDKEKTISRSSSADQVDCDNENNFNKSEENIEQDKEVGININQQESSDFMSSSHQDFDVIKDRVEEIINIKTINLPSDSLTNKVQRQISYRQETNNLNNIKHNIVLQDDPETIILNTSVKTLEHASEAEVDDTVSDSREILVTTAQGNKIQEKENNTKEELIDLERYEGKNSVFNNELVKGDLDDDQNDFSVDVTHHGASSLCAEPSKNIETSEIVIETGKLKCSEAIPIKKDNNCNKRFLDRSEKCDNAFHLDDIVSKYKTDYTYSSSPGLSDVSAESLSSSDAEKESWRSRKESEWGKTATKTDATLEERDDARRESTDETRTANEAPRACGNRTGVSGVVSPSVVNGDQSDGQVSTARNAAKYTSLVMITNDTNNAGYQQVSVVTSDTTKVVPDKDQVVVVSHTNRQNEMPMDRGRNHENSNQNHPESNVTVITSAETLSAFEEGLADDDSWVENLSYEDDDNDDDFPTNSISEASSSGDEVTLTCSAAIDHEEDLRGYHRAAIDFTLHTIVEESCEESEHEQAPQKPKKERPASATDLEKYFFFGLGDGTVPSINSNREDAFSETSSIYSEGMESLGGGEENQNENSEELASSRLEKYFLSGFMGFTAERRDSDGSVGSDSEGKPSPEQRRKRLVRARGTGRSHSNSLDNLLGNPDLAGSEQQLEPQNNSEDSSSSDSDTYDEILGFQKDDGQFDTVKRKKAKKQKASLEDIKNLETTQEEQEDRISDEDDDRNKTPQPEVLPITSNLTTNKNQQSRDSGFVGSCDDLLKDQREFSKSPEISTIHERNLESIVKERKEEKTFTESLPPATNLTRKDSFNNWSSDEETNLMMCKMRQFFKTMVANYSSSKPSTPNLSSQTSPKPLPRAKTRCKPPQLVYFENELTRLMKTVPGIRDDQVREIVEYLSSEDTWSDSYDSSDYTSSDLEGTSTKSALQQQISDSCKQIINKFDTNAEKDEEGDAGDGGIIDDTHGLNKETAFVYQKLVASFEKMATEDRPASTSGPNSPPLIAKVMHHIGSRLVALMHEVSSGESHASNSPKGRNYHRRLQQKLSNASTTTTDDDSTSDTNLPDTFVEGSNFNMLPRSRSHDLLMGDGNKNQSISGVSEISEEREASDCERFSWRGSFESALLATDSRNRLSLIGGEGSASASALAIAAKRRSAGDLLFSHKSLSREQLDRVRSCGSIGGSNVEDKLWVSAATKPNRRRSSVPDAASCGSGASADGEDEDEEMENRATLPRSVQSGPQSTNSLPRLPTSSVSAMQKAQSHHFLPAKSARYRPPGFSRLIPSQPKRAVSAPGLQPSHQRRGRRSQLSNVPSDDVSISEAHSSPMLASRSGSKSATPSPVAPATRRKIGSVSSQEWPSHDDDIDRLVSMHHNRSSLSSLGPRSDSMASVYSGAGDGRYGSVTVRGQVEFGLQYNYKAGALEILIKQCKDLAPVDSKRNRSDPYVKVYLLPDKSKSGKRKTKVKKHTLNPVFDECLKFHMSLNELEIRTLWLTVWHSDMFGRNDFLGEVMMTLENKVFDDPTPKWYNLQERTEPFDDMLSFKGDIIVCLKFVPPDMTVHKKGKRSRGSLHVLVKEAKALTAVKANGTSDPFCKSYLLPEKGRSCKQKTAVVRRSVNPVWNHTFVYDDVTLQELAERSLELTVWDHDRLASNEFLGGVRFSLGTGKHYGKSVEWMDATGKELSLWKSMLERPNFWVEGCLALRPTLDTRIS